MRDVLREFTQSDVSTPEVSLTPRQLECLRWVQEGKSSRDIGVILGISHRIVERHVFRACQRLGVRTRLQAVIRARTLGLIGDDELEARSWSPRRS